MKIIINGAVVEVEGNEISYELVQRIAFNGKAIGNHSVTFHNAAPPETDGILLPGATVQIVEGTLFNVSETGDA